MTETGKLFAEIIYGICWTKGWGTTGTSRQFPDQSHGEELKWLVENGYLFHYQYTAENKKRNWRYRYSTADIYGLTKKGWSIAGKYIDAYVKEINPDRKLEYMYDWYPRRPFN